MRSRSERGEGRLQSIIWLAILVTAGYAAWNVVPVFIDNLTFKDKMQEIARSPRGTNPDEKVMDMLAREVREKQLDKYLNVRGGCKIATRETGRTISCAYDREVEVLPGVKHTFRFDNTVEQPLIF